MPLASSPVATSPGSIRRHRGHPELVQQGNDEELRTLARALNLTCRQFSSSQKPRPSLPKYNQSYAVSQVMA